MLLYPPNAPQPRGVFVKETFPLGGRGTASAVDEGRLLLRILIGEPYETISFCMEVFCI